MGRATKWLSFAAISLPLLPAYVLAESCDIWETFDGGFQETWQLSDPDAVRAIDDVLRVQFSGPSTRDEHAVLDRCVFGNMTLQVRLRDLNSTRAKIIEFGRHGDFAGYGVNFRSDPYNDAVLAYGENDQAEILEIVPYAHSSGQWLQVELRVSEALIEVDVDGISLISFDASAGAAVEGWLSLGGNAGGDGEAYMEFDDLIISSTDAVGDGLESWGAVKGRFGSQD